ncbi:toxin-antitoxin system YwqK family antitoxin [Winogradskyella forsetii]|uniref:toxin-antitoxin system YwqK family antitoxin n=1 Tax=Winogradskyella forsetii TaxID=2686077 RepID=UPI0015BC84C6|nr:hypothetical protein [Winogradskyella forsetii]
MYLNYIFCLFLAFNLSLDKKEFIRNFDTEGHLKSEGWVLNGQKTDFWTFHHSNGRIEKKGHFKNGKKTGYWYFYSENNKLLKEGSYTKNTMNDWWTFYSEKGKKKIQYINGVREGFALVYINNSLKKAERYKSNIKTGEWTSYFSFMRDNPGVKF